MPKWVYPLAFAFLLYVIYSDAGSAGQMANGFAGFLGNLLGAVGDFLTGLFEGPSNVSDGLSTDGSGSITLNGSQSSTSTPPVTLNGANADSFGTATSDHTHVHNHD